MMKSLVVVLAAALSVIQYASGQGTCSVTGGNIGDSRYMLARTARNRDNFYLNVADPASCSGIINYFSYCYYRPEVATQLRSYVFTFAIYRENSSVDGTYDVVSSVFIAQRTSSDVTTDLGSGNFACVDFTVNDPVPVNAGDVLGACVSDPLVGVLVRQLDIVGRLIDGERGSSMLLRTDEATGCTPDSVPSSVIPSKMSESRLLHLYANIETQRPPTSSAPTTMGTVPVTTVGDTTGPSTNTTGIPSGGANTGATAAAVVIVLIILIVSIVITAVVFVLLTKKHKSPKRVYSVKNPRVIQDGIDNVMYSSGNANAGDGLTATAEYEEVGSRPATKPLVQSEAHYEFDEVKHTYEYEEASFSNSARMNEYAYAEVGPYKERNHRNTNANVCSPPLNEQTTDYSRLLEKNREEDIYGNENPFTVPASQKDEIYAQLKTWGVQAIALKDIEVVGHLGSGQFGSVEQGQWKRQGTKPVDVALKSLNKESPEEDKVKFLQEAATMGQFRHPNVILLHGVVTRGKPIMLVVEMATRGDLRELLLSMRPDPGELVPGNTPNNFLMYSQQVALGMQYLSAKGFVHRDLAARNVLVSASNVCKVADFGMSRDLADENYYVSHGGKVPVKWTAPEALHYKKYSSTSDVWAYGCLLYEIWSVGYKPFEGIPNVKVVRLVDSGKRLSPPPGSPRMIYELMILCWHPETSIRPAFRDIVLTLVGSEQMVLNIPEEDSSSNPLAGVLGAPLEAGENMYTDLQKRYDSDEVAI